MVLYSFRLEAQDGSGHYRAGTISITAEDLERTGAANAKQAARQILEERERTFAAFRLAPEHEQALVEAYGKGADELPQAAPLKASEDDKAEFRDLAVNHRAWLNLHRQEKPYKLTLLEKAD